MRGLLPQVCDLWMAEARYTDDQGFGQAVAFATGMYADVLQHPWGVLCALSSDSSL